MNDAVVVANYRTRVDAEIAGAVLESQGIPFVIQSAEGMLHGPIGPGADLLVAESQADLARALLTGEEREEGQGPDAA